MSRLASRAPSASVCPRLQLVRAVTLARSFSPFSVLLRQTRSGRGSPLDARLCIPETRRASSVFGRRRYAGTGRQGWRETALAELPSSSGDSLLADECGLLPLLLDFSLIHFILPQPDCVPCVRLHTRTRLTVSGAHLGLRCLRLIISADFSGCSLFALSRPVISAKDFSLWMIAANSFEADKMSADTARRLGGCQTRLAIFHVS